MTDDVKARLHRGETVHYEVAFDFELVKKQRLYEATRSGTMDLKVLITPRGLEGKGPGGYLVHVQDITDRKRAEAQLAEQLDELRRWQNVMLDREDRVQELKREVNDLCRRTGEPPRYPSQEKA